MKEFEQILDNAEKSMRNSGLIYRIVSDFVRKYPEMRIVDIFDTSDMLLEAFNIELSNKGHEQNQGFTLSRAERRALKHNKKRGKSKQ